jgi:murein DD-endopeptidase MepM/ murein hydrolase activator NlpD
MRQIFHCTAMVGRIVLLLVSATLYFFSKEAGYLPERNPAPAAAVDTTVAVKKMDLVVFHHTIARGQTLAEILANSLVQPEDVFPALEALHRVFDPRRLKPGHELQVLVDSAGALHQLTYEASPEVLVRVQREVTGDFCSRFDSLQIIREPFAVSGQVQSTLYEAVQAAQESPELLLAYTDIFQWDIDFFLDPRRGDRFRMVFEKLFIEKEEGRREFVRYGRILAATYEQADTTYFACFFADSTARSGYFDRNGGSFQKTFLKSPLNYRRISSFFSNGRRHPILKKVRAHTGVDFAAPRGTPVAATADGIVREMSWNGGYGNCVIIDHKNHFTTLYGHFSRYAGDLKIGKQVKQGELVGYVGATGLATGPHLHYTMYLNGRPINPLRLRPASAEPLARDALALYAVHREAMMRLLQRIPPSLVALPMRELATSEAAEYAIFQGKELAP